ncbi:TRAP transporter small permease subunit [Affinirhizobium pseudoryzae]|uniref:TRAP transporter small permease subunit n=1 Tax=Allorhizobium pseudoryzae TaxID=379684 RepID=UPI0013EA16F3|nr:TRAP transporter small permease [Allorhizobium pseudoryzae]
MTGPNPLLTSLFGYAEKMTRIAVLASGTLTIASVLLITVDVLLRKFIGWTVGGSDELSGYAFAISTTWSLAYATLQRANVRVDVIYQYLPVRISAVLDWLSLVCLGVFIGFVTYYGYGVVAESISNNSQANTPLGTPLAIPQGLWFAGLVFMCLILAMMLIRASVALVTGDIETVKAITGVRSTKEEAEEEAAAGERLIEGERT